MLRLNYRVLLMAFFVSTSSFAEFPEVDLTILSPTDNGCVSSTNGIVQAIAGQPFDYPTRDSTLRLRVDNPDFFSARVNIAVHNCGDTPCTASTDANGQPMVDDLGHPVYSNIVPTMASTRESTFDFFFDPSEEMEYTIAADSIVDGHVSISVTMTFNCFDDNGVKYNIPECDNITADPTDAVVIATRFDRMAPEVTFTPDQLATIAGGDNACDVNNDTIEPTVVDVTSAIDQNKSTSTTVVNGCEVNQVMRFVDDCGAGNGVEYVWTQLSPPQPTDVSINLTGNTCADTDGDFCIAGPNGFENFVDGGRIVAGAVDVAINAPAGCVTSTSSKILLGDDQGQFPASCEADPDRCIALNSGQAITTPGIYRAEVTVGACDDVVNSATLDFEILDGPQVNFGGPYVVSEGDNLILDASGSSVPNDPALGTIVLYEWNLDGLPGYTPNVGDETIGPVDKDGMRPSFSTVEDGIYEIGLRITTSTGIVAELPKDCLDECEADIECEAACRALGTIEVADVDPTCNLGGPYTVFDGEVVTFEQTAVAAGSAADPLGAYQWNFDVNAPQGAIGPNAQTGVGLINPSAVFTEQRVHTVELELFDEDSSTTCTTTVTVLDSVPVISALQVAENQELLEGSPIAFRATTSAGSSSDRITNHVWDFGDGNTDSGESARQVEHTYLQSGDYEVCLTVHDADSSTQQCITVTVAEVSPIPVFTLPTLEMVQGGIATFNASDSLPGGLSDPIDHYVWKFTSLDNPGENPDLIRREREEKTVNYQFEFDGRYEVELTVWDTDSSAATTREVFVADAVPTAGIRGFYPRPEEIVLEGESLLLSGGSSQPGAVNDQIVEYRWDFGDGQSEVYTMDNAGNVSTGTSYAWGDEGTGTFIVELTVKDVDGSQATAQTQVSVLNVAPELQLYPTEERVEVGQAVQFMLVHESDTPQFNAPTVVARVKDVFADFATTEATWTVDGVEFNPTIPMTFDNLGEKVIRCEIHDGDGGRDEAATTLTVTPAAPQFEAIGTQTGVEGEPLSFSLRVNAPVVGPNEFGPVALDILEKPTGSTVTTNEQADGVIINFDWTPGFYDSGTHRLWLRAGQNDSERFRTIDIQIADNGRPLAVALGGSSARGTISLFEFGETAGEVSLEATDQLIDLGLGVGEMVQSPDSGYLFATVPGSNRVAVVDLRGNGALIRRIPVGNRPTGIIAGGGKIWVVHHGDSTISAIDPTSLKVVSTVPLNGLDSPTDLVWLNEGFDGLDRAYIAVIASGNGSIGLVDPERVMQFVSPVEEAIQLGGILTNIEADSVNGTVEISDETTRRIYSIRPSDLNEDFDGSTSQTYPITFAARDLMVKNGSTWVAQGDSVINIGGDGIQSLPFVSGSVMSSVAQDITADPLLLLFSNNRIKVYRVDTGPSLDLVTDVPSGNVRRLLTLIAPTE